MRLSALFLRCGVFALAGVVSVVGATSAATFIEQRSLLGVREVLIDQGHEWTSTVGDGLSVILEGQAPSEADRFRAIAAAGQVVDASRVIDNMSVAESDKIAPPQFAMEIMRNDSGVFLIGLIPASSDRAALADRITTIADGKSVADLLEQADYPAPESWRPALSYALRALEQLPRSKISVTASRVAIEAISDSKAQKRQLEVALTRNQPDGVRVALDITAPRPVISPFTTRFTLDENGARFDACAVNDQDAEQVIVTAAREAGFTGSANCTPALGAPSRTWGEAVALSINAVGDLEGGTVTVADTEVALVAATGTPQIIFDNVVGELENALPDVFALTADLPKTPDADAQGPPTFSATRSPEGAVQLRGRVPNELTNQTAENFALAKFGRSELTMGTRVVDGLPAGWPVRVLAGIEVLSELSNGSVIVEPEKVTVRGNTGNESARADISRLLITKLGETAEFDIDVTYVKQLDPAAGLPSPDECVAQIVELTDRRKITFDPGSATLTAETQPLVDDIAEILKLCANLDLRIAGYTDSQGGEDMNQQLSQQRAQAVLDALRLRRIPVSSFEAVGYGEDNPIADNETADGREANRRIEFSLITPDTASDDPSTPADDDAEIEEEAASE